MKLLNWNEVNKIFTIVWCVNYMDKQMTEIGSKRSDDAFQIAKNMV